MNSQTLILDRIASAIGADQSIVLIRDPQYSNTGTLRTLDRDTLVQIAAVHYDFQRSYCNFKVGIDYVATHSYGQARTATNAAFVQGSIPDLVTAVVSYLTERTHP